MRNYTNISTVLVLLASLGCSGPERIRFPSPGELEPAAEESEPTTEMTYAVSSISYVDRGRNGTMSFEYDERGRLIRFEDSAMSFYDDHGTVTYGSGTGTISYEGNKEAITYSTGGTIEFALDDQGRRIDNGGDNIVYNALGNLVELSLETNFEEDTFLARETWHYDERGCIVGTNLYLHFEQSGHSPTESNSEASMTCEFEGTRLKRISKEPYRWNNLDGSYVEITLQTTDLEYDTNGNVSVWREQIVGEGPFGALNNEYHFSYIRIPLANNPAVPHPLENALRGVGPLKMPGAFFYVVGSGLASASW